MSTAIAGSAAIGTEGNAAIATPAPRIIPDLRPEPFEDYLVALRDMIRDRDFHMARVVGEEIVRRCRALELTQQADEAGIVRR